MIRPGKHLNLNVCVLRIAAIVLRHLQRLRVESFDGLLAHVRDHVGNDAEIWFVASLDFVYLMGRVEYRPQTDTFEFVGHDLQ
jgi:ABC-three component (ABC-3C) system Middle Component 8